MAPRPTWAEVDLDALVRNYQALADLLDARPRLIPVVKADAYGHGAVAVTRALAGAGATAFAVALVEEGLALRDAGITQEILVLEGAWPGQECEALAGGLTLALSSPRGVRRLEEAAATRSSEARVHIKIDTGMTRLGVRWNDLGPFVEALSGAGHLRVTGTFSHLACAEEEDRGFTAEQISRLRDALDRLRRSRVDPGEIHMANSGGLLYWDELRAWSARPGIALYGYPPAPHRCPVELKPVLALKSRIGRIHTIAPGDPVGYNRSFLAGRETRVATVPVGYADGYRRSMSGAARVIVEDHFAAVLGTISMDLIAVDVTDIPSAGLDGEVILLGSSPNCRLDAAAWAGLLGTIPYEILCGISPRVPRRLRGGP